MTDTPTRKYRRWWDNTQGLGYAMTDQAVLKKLLTVPCGTCNGSKANPNTPMGENVHGESVPRWLPDRCSDCGGRGWQPAEDVEWKFLTGEWYLLVPLSMLEVSDENNR